MRGGGGNGDVKMRRCECLVNFTNDIVGFFVVAILQNFGKTITIYCVVNKLSQLNSHIKNIK